METAREAPDLGAAYVLLEALGADPLGSPYLPGYRGSPNGRTAALAIWFARQAGEAIILGLPDHAVRCQRYARSLERCALFDGWRCGQPVCPRCECRAAKRYRRRMEARLRERHGYALVTLTVACGDLRAGRQALFGAFAELRRRTIWTRAVAGGEAHLQVRRSEAGTWNVHLHGVVQLHQGQTLALRSLDAPWRDLLGVRGLVGNGHAKPLRSHWATQADPQVPGLRHFLSKPAFYVTARKPRHDLPTLAPADLDALLRFLPGQRRVSSFGCWRGQRRRSLSAAPTTTERKTP